MAGHEEYRSINPADDEFLAELEEGMGCTCRYRTPEQKAATLERARKIMEYFDDINQRAEGSPAVVIDLQ